MPWRRWQEIFVLWCSPWLITAQPGAPLSNETVPGHERVSLQVWRLKFMEKFCDPANIQQKSSPGADQINNLWVWFLVYHESICDPSLIGWGESLEQSDWLRSRHLNPIFWISDTGKHLIGFSTRRINYCSLFVVILTRPLSNALLWLFPTMRVPRPSG